MPEILTPLLAPVTPTPAAAVVGEPEILWGRRAFYKAQALLGGGALGPAQPLMVGWYGSSLQSELGSFGCIGDQSGLDDLIGEIVLVSYQNRSVYAYILQSVTLPDDGSQIALTLRTFLAICRPSAPAVQCSVAVTG
jgi:hypothetical protein